MSFQMYTRRTSGDSLAFILIYLWLTKAIHTQFILYNYLTTKIYGVGLMHVDFICKFHSIYLKIVK
jgi:hypothetical protein